MISEGALTAWQLKKLASAVQRKVTIYIGWEWVAIISRRPLGNHVNDCNWGI
jgi:hypothetical protein